MESNNIERATELLLHGLGLDLNNDSLKETPRRVAAFYAEFMQRGEREIKLTTFNGNSYDQMITQKNIPFYSLCEHHLLPFFGTVAISYVPSGNKIVGLSKLARVVERFASKPQTQEYLCMQIAEFLQDKLQPVGIAVSITARHLCMEMRGIRSFGTETTTCAMFGVYKTDATARAEFLNAINKQ